MPIQVTISFNDTKELLDFFSPNKITGEVPIEINHADLSEPLVAQIKKTRKRKNVESVAQTVPVASRETVGIEVPPVTGEGQPISAETGEPLLTYENFLKPKLLSYLKHESGGRGNLEKLLSEFGVLKATELTPEQLAPFAVEVDKVIG